ncbi:MAG TPA: hypothetical protein VJV78_14130 [Polyangiales bacterium]|nr:hypothetical protein [Polyangiales bacterium]
MSRGSIVLALLLCLTGCESDDPCDSDQVYKQGACLPKPEKDAGDKAEPDSGSKPVADGGGGGGDECKEDQAAILGKTCSDDTGCNCAAPYCAKQPGQAMGFCTVYCTPMPDDCPADYRCFDLSALGVPGIKPFCVKK